MTTEEQRAWDNEIIAIKAVVANRPDNYTQPLERLFLSADAVIQRARDVEGIKREGDLKWLAENYGYDRAAKVSRWLLTGNMTRGKKIEAPR